jgi:hypothetical protein
MRLIALMQAQHSPNESHFRDDNAHVAIHFLPSSIYWLNSSRLLRSRGGRPQTAVSALRCLRAVRLSAGNEATLQRRG